MRPMVEDSVQITQGSRSLSQHAKILLEHLNQFEERIRKGRPILDYTLKY